MHPGSTGRQVHNYPHVISLINREQSDHVSSRRPPSIAQTLTAQHTSSTQLVVHKISGQHAMSVVRGGRGRPTGHTAGQLCHASWLT